MAIELKYSQEEDGNMCDCDLEEKQLYQNTFIDI